MIKGLAKDEMTLKKLGVTKGSKVMVIGSSLNDVLQVSTTPKDVPKDLSSTKETSSSRFVSFLKLLLALYSIISILLYLGDPTYYLYV